MAPAAFRVVDVIVILMTILEGAWCDRSCVETWTDALRLEVEVAKLPSTSIVPQRQDIQPRKLRNIFTNSKTSKFTNELLKKTCSVLIMRFHFHEYLGLVIFIGRPINISHLCGPQLSTLFRCNHLQLLHSSLWKS
jgi:hypothetical protein